MDTMEIEDRDLTATEREHTLEVATVIQMKQLLEQGHDLYDLIEAWQDATGATLDEALIKEMDRQGLW